MWLLSHDGGLFEGKRIWLRPGSRHLFGRTSPPKNTGGDTAYKIDSKTVSRQHLVIEVKPVEPGTCYRYDYKSQVVLTDNSTFGTQLDDEGFKKTERVVGGRTKGANSFAIKLGKWDKLFRLEWQQVNICYSTISSKAKASNPGDPLKDVHDRLEPFDIKIGFDYNPSHTTHVVANKRNTPKGLQALVNAKYIVTDAYMDAIEKQVARPKDAGPDVDMPLEKDFDGNWPDAMSFLPAKGKEPIARPADYFKPDKERESVFAGYTFIFCDKAQFETLQPPITQGGGKALHRELDMESSTSHDFVRYVKDVAGEKGMGEFEDGSEGKGVVVVRKSRGEGGQAADEWAKKFFPEVDLNLGQRSIEQNEFLDSILTNDASVLRRPLEEEVVSSSIPAPPASSVVPSAAPSQRLNARSGSQFQSQPVPPSDENDTPTTSQPPATQRRRGPRRGITVSRFKGFDDDDDIELSNVPSVEDDEPVEDLMPSQSQRAASPSQMPTSYVVEASQVSQSQSQPGTARGRKRSHESSPTHEEPEEDAGHLVDKLLPAATAMKRRRLEQQLQESAQERKETPAVSEKAEEPASRKRKADAKYAPEPAKKKKKKQGKYDPEVLDPVTERREMQEEERRKDEESMRMALEGMNIEQMTNLAKVEEMDIKPRSVRPAATEKQRAVEEGRWKEEWNGRKNFKKFRKRRPGDSAAGDQEIRRGHKVIVTLEEVKKDQLSMTDDFFESSGQPTSATQSTSGIRLGQRQRVKQLRHMRNASNKSDDDDDDEGDDGEEMFSRTGSRFSRRGSRATTTTHSQTPSAARASQNDRRSGPASAIVIDADDATEMQDVEPEEIAGQPRNERLVELIEETQLSGQQQKKRAPKGKGAKASASASASASAATGSTSPESTRSSNARSTRGRRAETPSQSQAESEVQVPRSTAGSTRSGTAGRGRGKKGVMGPPAGAQESSGGKRRGGGFGLAARKVVDSDEDEESENEDDLKFRFRRRRG